MVQVNLGFLDHTIFYSLSLSFLNNELIKLTVQLLSRSCVVQNFLLQHTDSLVVAHGLSSCLWALEHTGSVAVACGLGCPEACGILVP